MSTLSTSEWDDVKSALLGLITSMRRADGANWAAAFETSGHYLDRLELTKEIDKLRVLHIAGTKGKGSTAAFASSILANCGYKVGSFTSPHLCDVRERVRINGKVVSKAAFAKTFWNIHQTLQPRTSDDPPRPGYFRFLTYLALRMFVDAKVDVVVLEVGIGGRLDSTNVIPRAVATAVTTLDYDHVELLGDTLTLIAREKAGIFRQQVPAFTCAQVPEAMQSLSACAEEVDCPLTVAKGLEEYGSDGGIELGLSGDFQTKNASIAVELSRELDAHVCKHQLQLSAPNLQTGAAARLDELAAGRLPAPYAAGLAACRLFGRAQVAHVDAQAMPVDPSDIATKADVANGHAEAMPVTFFLDGAHSPESCHACAQWFSSASAAAEEEGAGTPVDRILVFNCGDTRQPDLLLEPFSRCLEQAERQFQHTVLAPANSTYPQSPRTGGLPDVTWQLSIADAWESLHKSHNRAALPDIQGTDKAQDTLGRGAARSGHAATVHYSLEAALSRIREYAMAQGAQGRRVHVLVTGSLHLVGDVLQLLGIPPE
eukprot:jgi/Ulvmu1/3111/UM015_0151.1